MRDQDNFGHSDSEQIPDAWWASLARRVLHRVQVEVIEALNRSDRPLSAVDLAEVVEGVAPGHLAQHHLRRLRKLGAIACAKGPMPRNVTEIPYELALELSDDAR
jgi:predicted MarR family transcription regulator